MFCIVRLPLQSPPPPLPIKEQDLSMSSIEKKWPFPDSIYILSYCKRKGSSDVIFLT